MCNVAERSLAEEALEISRCLSRFGFNVQLLSCRKQVLGKLEKLSNIQLMMSKRFHKNWYSSLARLHSSSKSVSVVMIAEAFSCNAAAM